MYMHVGMNVTNLEKSLEFYTKLFGQGPFKVKSDYAKFLLEDPALNFTLNLRSEVSGNQVGHFGFQVQDPAMVQHHLTRLASLGLETREEPNVTCCYAVQDKFWVHDPDGNEWEFFFTRSQSDVHRVDEQVACCN